MEHMTLDEYRRAITAVPKENKYHARSVDIDGMRFDSQREARRFQELRLMEMASQISDLKRQEVVMLSSGITWRMDFTYVERGLRVLEDFKGAMTREYKLKRRLLIDDIHRGFIVGVYRESTRDGMTEWGK